MNQMTTANGLERVTRRVLGHAVERRILKGVGMFIWLIASLGVAAASVISAVTYGMGGNVGFLISAILYALGAVLYAWLSGAVCVSNRNKAKE